MSSGFRRVCFSAAFFAFAFSMPAFALVAPQATFDCRTLKTMTQAETVNVKLADIQYCEGQGFSPPADWNRPAGGITEAGGGSVSLSARCRPRPDKCLGYAQITSVAPPTFTSINLPRANPNLYIPPFKTPVNGTVKLPCGGSMALDVGKLISQGNSFINNVKFGNAGSAISTGLNIASGLLSPCGGGIMGMLQGAINMVMPSGCSVNITSGVAATCSGSVLSLPAGVTMTMSSNGQLTLPNGGSFRDSLGANIVIPGNSTVSVNGVAPNLNVTVKDQSGATTRYSAGTASTVDIIPGNGGSAGGTVLIPTGTSLPVDSGSTTLPASPPPTAAPLPQPEQTPTVP